MAQVKGKFIALTGYLMDLDCLYLLGQKKTPINLIFVLWQKFMRRISK